MSEGWYCQLGGREIGPISSQQLRELAASGKVATSTHIRRGQMGHWVFAGQVKGLFASAETPPSPPASVGPPVPVYASQGHTPPTHTAQEHAAQGHASQRYSHLEQAVEMSSIPSATPISNDPPVSSPLTSADFDFASLDTSPMTVSGIVMPTYSRKNQLQQQRLVGLLAVIGAGGGLALFILIFCGGVGSGHSSQQANPQTVDKTSRTVPPLAEKPGNNKNMSLPVSAANLSKDATVTDKAADVPVKTDSSGNEAKKETAEGVGEEMSVQPPTGKPEDDFGIRSDESGSQESSQKSTTKSP
jgi:hypothetical protein